MAEDLERIFPPGTHSSLVTAFDEALPGFGPVRRTTLSGFAGPRASVQSQASTLSVDMPARTLRIFDPSAWWWTVDM